MDHYFAHLRTRALSIKRLKTVQSLAQNIKDNLYLGQTRKKLFYTDDELRTYSLVQFCYSQHWESETCWINFWQKKLKLQTQLIFNIITQIQGHLCSIFNRLRLCCDHVFDTINKMITGIPHNSNDLCTRFWSIYTKNYRLEYVFCIMDIHKWIMCNFHFIQQENCVNNR